ncbi:class I SAM-dependent methyltransferase [Chloroflexota bacterium]
MAIDEKIHSVRNSPFFVKNYLTARKGYPYSLDQLDIMVRIIKGQFPDVPCFLDIGSGDGVLSAVILEYFPGATGYLLDFSEEAVSAAKEKLDGFGSQLKFLTLDYANDMHWYEKLGNQIPFDVIVSGYSIHHQHDERKRQLYEEIFDILKPGGLFLNLEQVSSETKWVENIWDNLVIDFLYAARSDTSKDRKQVADKYYDSREKGKNINKLSPLELQCSWLREIGFQDVSIFFKIFQFTVFGGRKPL